MKILSTFKVFEEIPKSQLQVSFQRKWYHCNRIYLIESQGKFAAVSLNFFERLAHVLFRVDYFKHVFGEKTVTVISPSKIPAPKKEAVSVNNSVSDNTNETRTVISSSKKDDVVVDIIVRKSAFDYTNELVNIVSQVAGNRFGKEFDPDIFDDIKGMPQLKENHKRVIVIFAISSRRANVEMHGELIRSAAEAVGSTGRVVFEFLVHDERLCKEDFKSELFNISAKFPISKELQKRIEVNNYMRYSPDSVNPQLPKGESDRLASDLNAVLEKIC